ncbi:MAG: hypothetical protein QNJ14_15115 [Woeseiaceae bacterium]|nr:hypothetical protein [Woeseiaceae bacterium]
MSNSQPLSSVLVEANSRRRWPTALLMATLVGLAGCTISMPFRYADSAAREQGGSETLIVSLTMAEYQPGWKSRRVFWRYVGQVEESLADSPGLVGHSLRRQIIGNRAWTMTVWKDESSLRAFAGSPAHQDAIRQALPTLEDVRFARVELPAHEIPISWEQAEQLLETHGRRYPQRKTTLSSHQRSQ